jgi:hypothetical protein
LWYSALPILHEPFKIILSGVTPEKNQDKFTKFTISELLNNPGVLLFTTSLDDWHIDPLLETKRMLLKLIGYLIDTCYEN